MKVSKAIAMLKEMNPDEEIVIEWWDVHCFHGSVVDAHGDEVALIPHEVWNRFASDFAVRETVIEGVYEDIQWGLQDYIKELMECSMCHKRDDENEVQGGLCSDCFSEMPEGQWVSGYPKGGE